MAIFLTSVLPALLGALGVFTLLLAPSWVMLFVVLVLIGGAYMIRIGFLNHALRFLIPGTILATITGFVAIGALMGSIATGGPVWWQSLNVRVVPPATPVAEMSGNRDGDGWLDSVDGCPDLPGVAPSGCPTGLTTQPTPMPGGATDPLAPFAENVGVTGHCDPLAITNMPARPSLLVNNFTVDLQVRDLNSCGRPLFYHETGIDDLTTPENEAGENYTLNIPDLWVAVTASVSAQVHPDGGNATDYSGGPVVVIYGPWTGSVGIYEGAIRIYPSEWVDAALANEVLPIQRVQTGIPDLQAILIGK